MITANFALDVQRYPQPAQQLAFYDELEARVKRLPGVTSFALSDSLPPGGMVQSTILAGIVIEGRAHFAEGTGGMVGWRAVTPGYFSALRIPILRGRAFEEADRNPDQRALVLSDSLASRLFPGEDPVGKRLELHVQPPWFTVVGIAADVKNGGLNLPADPSTTLFGRIRPRVRLVIRASSFAARSIPTPSPAGSVRRSPQLIPPCP